jgi:hypothetical protein
VPIDACGSFRVLPVGGLDLDALFGVLPPLVLATLAVCSRAAFSLKRLACDNEVFSHANVSHRLALMVMTPFEPGIFIVVYAVWMIAMNLRRKCLLRMQL